MVNAFDGQRLNCFEGRFEPKKPRNAVIFSLFTNSLSVQIEPLTKKGLSLDYWFAK